VIVDACGERMIVNHLDPSLPVDATWLPSAGSVGARVVLADTRWPEGALTALVAARAAGCQPFWMPTVRSRSMEHCCARQRTWHSRPTRLPT